MYHFEDKLKEIIVSCSNDKLIKSQKINTDTDLIRDYNFNSINIITLVVEIERNFDIEIDDEDLLLDRISSYVGLVDILKSKLGEL